MKLWSIRTCPLVRADSVFLRQMKGLCLSIFHSGLPRQLSPGSCSLGSVKHGLISPRYDSRLSARDYSARSVPHSSSRPLCLLQPSTLPLVFLRFSVATVETLTSGFETNLNGGKYNTKVCEIPRSFTII